MTSHNLDNETLPVNSEDQIDEISLDQDDPISNFIIVPKSFFSGKNFPFNVEIATKFGLPASAVYTVIFFLNQGKENSSTISSFMPFMSKYKIKKAIKKLIDAGIIHERFGNKEWL